VGDLQRVLAMSHGDSRSGGGAGCDVRTNRRWTSRAMRYVAPGPGWGQAANSSATAAKNADRPAMATSAMLSVVRIVPLWQMNEGKLHLLDLGGDIAGNGLSKLFLTIAAAFAEAERDRIRERISQVKADQKARGRFLGYTPRGWEGWRARHLRPVALKRSQPFFSRYFNGSPHRRWLDHCRVQTEEEIADCQPPAVSDPALRQMVRPIVQHVAALAERAQIL
jgi:hypothetical protein